MQQEKPELWKLSQVPSSFLVARIVVPTMKGIGRPHGRWRAYISLLKTLSFYGGIPVNL